MTIAPIIPTVRRDAFDNPDWSFELKYDGFRALADTVNGRMVSKASAPRPVLRAAKRRGTKLGNLNIEEAQTVASAAIRANAEAFAANVLPIIRQAQAAGARSLRAIA